MVQQRYGYVTHAFVFTIRDRDDWSPYENNFGLVRLDGTPKPALAALRHATTGSPRSGSPTPGASP